MRVEVVGIIDMQRITKLAIAVALAQTFLAVVVFGSAKVDADLTEHLRTAKVVIVGLNFPVVAFWTTLLWPANYLPYRGQGLEAPMAFVAATLLAVSVGSFWYIAIREAECRLHHSTTLQHLSRAWQFVVLVTVLIIGIESLWYSYVSSRPLWFTNLKDAAITGFLPLLWGILFLTSAGFDFNRWARRSL